MGLLKCDIALDLNPIGSEPAQSLQVELPTLVFKTGSDQEPV